MKLTLFRRGAATAALLCCLTSGCKTESSDPETRALQDRYVLASEPGSAMTLTELANRLDGKIATADEPTYSSQDQTAVRSDAPQGAAAPSAVTQPVVIVGRVYAGDMEPWDPGKASFLLAELPEEGHGEGHDADNCPFCKRKAANAPTAIVQFVDEQGQVIPRDARKLFGIQKKDVVTVRGHAERGELNTLIVTANAIHVRRN
jgi:hypothetical protein